MNQGSKVDISPDGTVTADGIRRDAPEADEEAAGEPQSAPSAAVPATDIVAELVRKLTAAAQKGRRELDKTWLGLSDLERDLARPMRAQYREIAADAEAFWPDQAEVR
jgi:hypothetical protein